MTDKTTAKLTLGLLSTDVPGLMLTGTAMENAVDAINASFGRLVAPEQPHRLGLPPVISRALLEEIGYVESFPHLLGTIHSYAGDERQWRELSADLRDGDWTRRHQLSDVVMLPSTCYHAYPLLADAVLDEPVRLDISGHCYRHERTAEPGRLRSFRQREIVRIDAAEPLRAWRDGWLELAAGWFKEIGIEVGVVPASDPFFGDAERLVGRMQRVEGLKWECVGEVARATTQALLSVNLHKDHFTSHYRIAMASGEDTYSGCIGLGIDRVAMAVLHRHGPYRHRWPAELRA